MTDNQESKELEQKEGDSYDKELLTEMRVEVIWTHVATMPIPLYERIKARIKQFDQVNIWRKQAEDNVYKLAQKLKAQKESLTTLDSEKAMNAELTEQLTAIQQALDSAVEAKNSAYNERNQLVAALSKIFPSWLGMHDLSDSIWNAEWRNIVYINAPTGQLSWHLHDNDMIYFQHLKFDENIGWDRHSTEEKYRRLASISGKEEV